MKEFRIREKLMGCAFELAIVHADEFIAYQNLYAGVNEIKRIENKLSEFISTSETSLINKTAGISPQYVSDETYALLNRCKHLYNISQGAFDITTGPLKKMYRFIKDEFEWPNKNKVNKTLEVCGMQNLILSKNNTVYAQKKGMHISFAAIGKGYAADCVKKIWLQSGIKNGIINASGDITVIGENKNNQSWQVGIPNPVKKEEIMLTLSLQDKSIATSGGYEQYFTHRNELFSHTIHPKTGFPIKGFKSISVIGPNAELCDALATVVYVMGDNAGFKFIEQLPDIYCISMNESGKIQFSNNINYAQA